MNREHVSRRHFLRLLPAAALCSCGDNSSPPAPKFPKVKWRITSTTPFISDLVKVIGGDAVDARCFVPLEMNLHSFMPTAQDNAKFHTSDMVINHGLGLESKWGVDFDAMDKNGVHVFSATAGIPDGRLLRPSGPGGPPDPHVWMHPDLAALMVDAVEAALEEVMPNLAAYFTPRAHKLRLAFQDALKFVGAKMKELKPAGRFLLTTHDSMQYFAVAFGLEARALAAPGEPVPETLPADIAAWITEHSVKSLFREPFTDALALRRLLVDLKVDPDHIIYSLTLPAAGTSAMVGFKPYNVFNFAEAMHYSADMVQSTLEVD